MAKVENIRIIAFSGASDHNNEVAKTKNDFSFDFLRVNGVFLFFLFETLKQEENLCGDSDGLNKLCNKIKEEKKRRVNA